MLTCDALIRELALPSAGHDRNAVAEHLATCADFAELSDAWLATRPVEPSPAAWDAIWSKVSHRLDALQAPAAPEPATVLPMTNRPMPFASYAFVAAQAAALLVAAVLGFGASRPDRSAAAPTPVVVAKGVDIEPGEVILIRFEGKGLKAIGLAADDRSGNGIESYFSMYNDVEALSE